MNPVYPEVVSAGKTGNTIFLDLGCCCKYHIISWARCHDSQLWTVGTDVRKLVADGYPAAHVMGCDLRAEFIDYGHQLYQDTAHCPIHFFASDIFEVPHPFPADAAPPAVDDLAHVTDLKQLRGAVTHFYTGALFHLFDEPTQYALALRVAALLKRVPGAVVFGRHQGLAEAGMIDDHLGRYVTVERLTGDLSLASSSRIRYGHSPTSWPLLWQKVFSEVESPEFAEKNVVVKAELTAGFHRRVFEAKAQTNMLVWSVKLV